MASKDKEIKPLNRLKQFFGYGKGSTGNYRSRVDFALTPELERDISSETPTPQRLKTIRELCETVLSTNHLEDRAVEKLWQCTCDLLLEEQARECRHAALHFLRCLIQGQYEALTIMRVQFFKVVTQHQHPEDTQQRLELLNTLTDGGKDIKYFEEEIGKFMLQWMPTVTSPELTQSFLSILVNLFKYNAAYLPEDVISGFVNNTCYLCCYSSAPAVVLGCLQVLEAVVCYAIFPHEALDTLVSALCRTVNIVHYCQPSWKIMRSVLGTDLGHSALHVMCVSLGGGGDCGLIRGAVFYLNMALWGQKRVATLKCTPMQVLPSFLKALEGNQMVVTYEVVLAMQSLVNKHGKDIHEPAWDLICSILLTIIKQIDGSPSPYQQTVIHLHETITSIEQLHEMGHFNGSQDNLYGLIDMCGHSRPEQSVFRLIGHLTSQVIPTNNDWLLTLNRMVERYCRQEARVAVRLKVLATLQTIVEQNRCTYEEELLDRVVLPNLQHWSVEPDPTIRCAAAKLLIDLAMHCHSKRFTDIFDILEKLLNRPFELYISTSEPVALSPDTDVSDLVCVALGAVRVFLHKLQRPPAAHAVRAYRALLNHLQQHYARPALLENHPNIRLKLLECFLSARANSLYNVGFPCPVTGRILYSPYVCVEGGEALARSSHSPTPQPPHQPSNTSQSQISYVSIRKACKIMITCLKQEKDWTVLQLVLREIPNVMQNKALVLSKNGNDIDLLASALCSMVAEKALQLPETLRNTPGKMTRSDFHAAVLPVLTCLAPYKAQLDSQLQQRIIKCIIQFGLVVSRCAQQCVTALTIFTLEMRESMVKLLPEVLLDLSKISATVYIAVPILEFLSTLTRLPKVFASFVDDQYMSVFAILLPYTNPFKYNHYIVSLAHHVIAAWFLKCRLPFRRGFVTFIKHGLHNNILKPFEEGKLKKEFPDLNQDSSNRKRSSSLTEQGSRRRELPSRPALGELHTRQEASNTFHIELTETCIDLMARYTYSPYISAPKRLPTADFLLSGGQSMSWLLGHKIITVTTSGCSQNTLRQGLCERCLVLCKAHTDSLSSPYGAGTSGNLTAGSESDRGSSEGLLQAVGGDVKRYSKYTFQHSKSNETNNSSSSISDNVLCPPSGHNTLSLQSLSGHTTRQNSSENKSLGEALPGSPKSQLDSESAQPAQLSLKLENLANKESSEEKSAFSALPPRLERVLSGGGSSGGAGGGGGGAGGAAGGASDPRAHCGCWCGGWAEIHVRGPTGDVSWVMRIQNQVNLDSPLADMPLNDISSLFLSTYGGSGLTHGLLGSSLTGLVGLAGLGGHSGTPGPTPQLGSAASIASSGFADARSDVLSDGDPRSRSGSGGSQPEQLQKSSSDSVVAGAAGPQGQGARAPHAATHCIVPPPQPTLTRSHASTVPINIPGSPQRQSSSGTNTDDEEGQSILDPSQALLDEQGKSRHPVRRSNSSPEMSSSWKNPFHVRECLDAMEGAAAEGAAPAPGQPETTNTEAAKPEDNLSLSVQSKKGAMKSVTKDMRVSCEAIPEEMSGSTPPHPSTHPHLMTYNSDPGGVPIEETTPLAAISTIQQSFVTVSVAEKSDQSQNTENYKGNKPADLFIPNSNKNVNVTFAAGDSKISQDIFKLSAKPPHSPAPNSPRPAMRMQPLSAMGRANPQINSGRSNSLLPSDSNVLRNAANLNLKFAEGQASQQALDDLPPLSRSKRSYTISVMSPTRKRRDNPPPKRPDSSRLGISPAFVFLQLYHGLGAGGAGGERPLQLAGPHHSRSVSCLDRVPPLETYKVGVLYVGRGQHDNETKILKNEFGSLRYAEFLQDLGTLIALEDAESMGLFLHVEKSGKDGRFAYVWQDDIMQVHFHVATLMPNNPSDPECNEKRKHIGNDFVSIVYNESGEDFLIQTIKGQFNFACIIIEPLDHGTNKVTIKTKGELIEREFLSQTQPKIISDQNVALLARQLALHANLASLISSSLSAKTPTPSPYASNWLERLRIIKRLRAKLLQEVAEGGGGPGTQPSAPQPPRLHMDDFTEYT